MTLRDILDKLKASDTSKMSLFTCFRQISNRLSAFFLNNSTVNMTSLKQELQRTEKEPVFSLS